MNKYFNSAIIGNGKALACLDEKAELIRLYYPNIDYSYTQSFLKAQTFMGTAKKTETKYNGVPGPNAYEVKRFADDIVEKGKKFAINKNKLKNIDKFLETH